MSRVVLLVVICQPLLVTVSLTHLVKFNSTLMPRVLVKATMLPITQNHGFLRVMIPEARISVKVRTHNNESSNGVKMPVDSTYLKETAQLIAQFFPRIWCLAPRGYSLSELGALTHRLTLSIKKR